MRKFILFAALGFFAGCAISPEVSASKAVNFTVISPLLKLNDAGFIHKKGASTLLQVYSSGVNLAEIDIKDGQICLNTACDDEPIFNQKFFKNAHYNGLFADIVNFRPIYDGRNLSKTECGFTQEIASFNYEICDNVVKFKDPKNGIKLVIKELE